MSETDGWSRRKKLRKVQGPSEAERHVAEQRRRRRRRRQRCCPDNFLPSTEKVPKDEPCLSNQTLKFSLNRRSPENFEVQEAWGWASVQPCGTRGTAGGHYFSCAKCCSIVPRIAQFGRLTWSENREFLTSRFLILFHFRQICVALLNFNSVEKPFKTIS